VIDVNTENRREDGYILFMVWDLKNDYIAKSFIDSQDIEPLLLSLLEQKYTTTTTTTTTTTRKLSISESQK
jgi:hypothetical protein